MSRYGLRVAHKGSSHLGSRQWRGRLKSSSFPWSPLTHEPLQLLCVSSTEHPSNAIFPLALGEVPTSTLLQVGMEVESCPSSLVAHSHITAHTAALTSCSLFPKGVLGFSAPSGCCRAEGLETDLSASAPRSQGAASTAAPKSEPEAVSAQHCAGCSWDVGTQI